MLRFKQFLLIEDAKSDAVYFKTKRILAQMAQMDKDTEERQNKVNPQTGKSLRQAGIDAIDARNAREKEAEDNLRRDRPNLAANIAFTSQSVARRGSFNKRAPRIGERKKDQINARPQTWVGMNPGSDLNAFNALSSEDQARVASGLRTGRLTDMQKAQYGISTANIAKRPDNAKNKLGANVVSGLNAIEKVVDERKSNAMGGAAGAGSFARAWGEDPDSIKTQKSMAVRTPRERLAMIDAQKEEGLRQFREKGKLDKGFVRSVNNFSNSAPAESETLQKFGQNSRQPMATSEEGRLARDREDNGQLSPATPNVSPNSKEKNK